MGDPLTVLLIEDDDSSRELGAFNLRRAGYEVDAAPNGTSGLELFDPARHVVVVTDIRMPGVSGMEVLSNVRDRSPETPVIVVTAYGNVELAVEAMKEGAADFIGKPFNRDHLLLAVDRAAEAWRVRRELEALRVKARGIEREIVCRSEAMTGVVAAADRAAASGLPVLLVGEHGTGKELLARRVHAKSRRFAGPFDALRVGSFAVADRRIALFGASADPAAGQGRLSRGASGTVYIGDFDRLDAAEQQDLGRWLEAAHGTAGAREQCSLDLRFVLGREPNTGNAGDYGNADLAIRHVGGVEIHVPPLRERKQDIAPLVEHFVARLAPGRTLEIPDELIAELEEREWVGNVRELANICERLVILCPGDRLRTEDLPPRPAPAGDTQATSDPFVHWPPLPREGLSLVDLERRVIERVLELKRGNVSAAAVYLQVPRHVLAYRMEKYGIKRKR